jgi:pyocin large subunit-like protein
VESTVPFDPFDREYLLQHFERHGADFGATTPEEYEALADRFMDGERSEATRNASGRNQLHE